MAFFSLFKSRLLDAEYREIENLTSPKAVPLFAVAQHQNGNNFHLESVIVISYFYFTSVFFYDYTNYTNFSQI